MDHKRNRQQVEAASCSGWLPGWCGWRRTQVAGSGGQGLSGVASGGGAGPQELSGHAGGGERMD